MTTITINVPNTPVMRALLGQLAAHLSDDYGSGSDLAAYEDTDPAQTAAADELCDIITLALHPELAQAVL